MTKDKIYTPKYQLGQLVWVFFTNSFLHTQIRIKSISLERSPLSDSLFKIKYTGVGDDVFYEVTGHLGQNLIVENFCYKDWLEWKKNLKYPIGKFSEKEQNSIDELKRMMEDD